MTRTAFALLIGAAALPAVAAPQVTLSSALTVVKTKAGPNGKPVVTYEALKRVIPGDRLSISLDWANRSGKAADHFVVTDPIPSGLLFADNASGGADLSVDGGKTFGPLAALKVTDPQGHSRAATMADVTHIRWAFNRSIAPGEHGQLRFEALVK